MFEVSRTCEESVEVLSTLLLRIGRYRKGDPGFKKTMQKRRLVACRAHLTDEANALLSGNSISLKRLDPTHFRPFDQDPVQLGRYGEVNDEIMSDLRRALGLTGKRRVSKYVRSAKGRSRRRFDHQE